MHSDQPSDHSSANATANPMQLLLLSDDTRLVSVIASLAELSEYTIDLRDMPSAAFSPEQSLTADLIVLDRSYGGKTPVWAIRALRQISDLLGAKPIATVLLCNEHQLAEDLNLLASAAHNGVDRFLLKTELSCKTLFAGNEQSNNSMRAFESETSVFNDKLFNDKLLDNKSIDDKPEAFEDGFLESLHQSKAQEVNERLSTFDNSEWLSHKIFVNFEDGQVSIDAVEPSNIFEHDAQLPIKDWLDKLTDASATDFQQTLNKAVNYHKLPQHLACNFRGPNNTFTRGQLIDISTRNNGRGRVSGLAASLLIARNEFLIPPLQETEQGALETLVKPETIDQKSQSDQANLAAIHTANLDKHSSEQTVAEAQRKLVDNRDIIRSLPVTCLILDADGRIVRIVNDTLIQAGLLPELQVGDSLAALMTTEQAASLQEDIRRCLNTGQNFQSSWNYSDEQGLRWFDTQISRILGSGSIQRTVLWTAFDISDSRENILELSRKEDNLNQIISRAPLLFFEKDSYGHYRKANSNFCEWVKVEESALIGRRDRDLFDDELCQYLQSLENHIKNEKKIVGDLMLGDLPSNDTNYQAIHWRGQLLKFRYGENVESIVGFGLPAANEDGQAKQQSAASSPIEVAQDGSTENLSHFAKDNSNINQDETAKSDLEHSGSFEHSGALKQDFKAMLTSIVSYTEMAISQKNDLRNQKILEQIEALDATSAKARQLILGRANDESEATQRDREQINNLQALTTDIIKMQAPTLPASLNFVTELQCPDAMAYSSATDFQRIVMQMISSARDADPVSDDKQFSADNKNPFKREPRKLLLTLKSVTVNASCDACGEIVEGDYLELAVHTEQPDLADAELDKLLKNARSAVQRSDKQGRRPNIIAMTHQQNGHTFISYDNKTLSLKLLFQRAN